MNKTAVGSVAVVAVTIVAIIVGYLGLRAQPGALPQSSSAPSGQFTARERAEALLACVKMQADGCYME